MQIRKILSKSLQSYFDLVKSSQPTTKTGFRRVDNQPIVNDSCQTIIDIGKRKEKKKKQIQRFLSEKFLFITAKSIRRRDIIRRRKIDVDKTSHVVTKR